VGCGIIGVNKPMKTEDTETNLEQAEPTEPVAGEVFSGHIQEGVLEGSEPEGSGRTCRRYQIITKLVIGYSIFLLGLLLLMVIVELINPALNGYGIAYSLLFVVPQIIILWGAFGIFKFIERREKDFHGSSRATALHNEEALIKRKRRNVFVASIILSFFITESMFLDPLLFDRTSLLVGFYEGFRTAFILLSTPYILVMLTIIMVGFLRLKSMHNIKDFFTTLVICTAPIWLLLIGFLITRLQA
jgi:hypothetical protein